MDSNPSQPSASTPVVAEMHKEDQQATSGLTSLGVTSKERANPQLSSGLENVLTQPITRKGASSIARQVEKDEASRTIKLEDLAKLIDEDEEANEVHATTNVETEDTLVPKSSSTSSLPTKLKELSSKFNELTEEELPAEFILVPTQVKVIQAKLKILDALPSLLHKVTNALNQFTQAIVSKKTKDNSVPLAGQAGTQPAEGEKNTIQATTS
uniref:Uncharacterized protein n=1 Tax=Tanacetum cinerariifolium TaxID=118510 RepID=A0A699J0Q9_TANCI|nr:hypothetical protein [Tanacetum cinerariifolium]